MRLSLMKAAHVALFGTAYRKYGYLPGFGRCGISRLSTGHSLPATNAGWPIQAFFWLEWDQTTFGP